MIPTMRAGVTFYDGKVSIGDRGGTNGAPQWHDYFTITRPRISAGSTSYDVDTELNEKAIELYGVGGKQPRELKIVLPFPPAGKDQDSFRDACNANFSTGLAAYRSSYTLCWCNDLYGEWNKSDTWHGVAHRMVLDDKKQPINKYEEMVCNPADCPYTKPDPTNKNRVDCQIVGTLAFEIVGMEGKLMYLRTRGWNSVKAITQVLWHVFDTMALGQVHDLPLVLRVTLERGKVQGLKGSQPFPVISLSPSGTTEEMFEFAIARARGRMQTIYVLGNTREAYKALKAGDMSRALAIASSSTAGALPGPTRALMSPDASELAEDTNENHSEEVTAEFPVEAPIIEAQILSVEEEQKSPPPPEWTKPQTHDVEEPGQEDEAQGAGDEEEVERKKFVGMITTLAKHMFGEEWLARIASVGVADLEGLNLDDAKAFYERLVKAEDEKKKREQRGGSK